MASIPEAAWVSPQLLDDMDTLFSPSNAIVLAVFEVTRLQQHQETTGSQLLKALGGTTFLVHNSPRPRLLCITVRRDKGGRRGFAATLHVVKPTPSAAEKYSVRDSYPMKQIREIHLLPGNRGMEGASVKGLELRMSSSLAASTVAPAGGGWSKPHPAENALAFDFQGEQHLLLVAMVWQLLRQRDLALPKLVGLEIGELSSWWAVNKARMLPALGDFGMQVLDPEAGAAGPGGKGSAGPRMLVSAKEERDVAELLDAFATGLADVSEFEARLATEVESLETANVHSLLSNAAQVDAMVYQLRKTGGLLEDVDETLQMFETKLRAMRDDIGAIESHNNSLELRARNNKQLLSTVQGLLSDVRIPKDCQAALAEPAFDSKRLTTLCKHGWVLVGSLDRLTSGSTTCLPPHLLKMRVAREAKDSMLALAGGFVTRACSYLGTQLAQVVDELAGEAGRNTDKLARMQPPEHAKLDAHRTRTADLVRLVRALDPAALARMQASYVATLNMLLRKELRAAAAELRKAAQLDAHNNPCEYGLTKEAHGSSRPGGGAGGSVFGGGSDGASVVSDVSGMHGGRPVSKSSTAGGRGVASPGSVVSRQSKSTVGTMSSMRLVLRATGGTFDGTSLALPLNEAYGTLLSAWVPHLMEECQRAAAYLLLHKEKESGTAAAAGAGEEGAQKLSPEGRELLAGLMAGMEPEFLLLVDLSSKGQQVLCMPMLASTTHWLVRMAGPPPDPADLDPAKQRPAAAAGGSSGATGAAAAAVAANHVARPLAGLLAACHERLCAHLAGWTATQLKAVEVYGQKAAAGVKALHVLPCTTQFALISHQVEMLLAESVDAQALLSFQAAATASAGPTARVMTSRRAQSLRRDASLASNDGLDDGVPGLTEPAAADMRTRIAAAIGWGCRAEIDKVYLSIVGHMFGILDGMAAKDAKHGARLRLENYTYFVESVRPLLRQVTSLQPYMVQAEARQEEAMQAYVQQQLEYAKLWKLLEFSAALDKLMEVMGPHEVVFQAGCSAADVRGLIQSSMKEADKNLGAMMARVRKHLGTSTLSFKVWERIQEQLLLRYERLEEQVADCYNGAVQLAPSPDELLDMFAGVGVGS